VNSAPQVRRISLKEIYAYVKEKGMESDRKSEIERLKEKWSKPVKAVSETLRKDEEDVVRHRENEVGDLEGHWCKPVEDVSNILIRDQEDVVRDMKHEIEELKKKWHEQEIKIYQQGREADEHVRKINWQQNKISELERSVKILSRGVLSEDQNKLSNEQERVLSKDGYSFRSNVIELHSPNSCDRDCIEFGNCFVELADSEESETELIFPSYQEGHVVDVLGDQHELGRKLGENDVHECIGELVMSFSGKRMYGTATLVWHDSDRPTFFLLTCAHNILRRTRREDWIAPIDVTFYRGRWGKNEFLSRHEVRKGFVHPNYKTLYEKYGERSMYQGADVAVCFFYEGLDNEFRQLKNNRKIDDLLQLKKSWNNSSRDDDLNITGYPDGLHCQYSMDGNVNEIKFGCGGKVLTYKNINTSTGHSGSPVMCESKIVGVHVGHSWEYNYNVATYVTPAIRQWMQDKINEVSQKQVHNENLSERGRGACYCTYL